MNANTHGYPYQPNDIAYVIGNDLTIREGICVSYNGVYYTFLMNDTNQQETFLYDQLYGLKSEAQIAIQTKYITPTPSTSFSPSPTPSRTPQLSSTRTITPTPSSVYYPNLLIEAQWSGVNGIVNVDHDGNDVLTSTETNPNTLVDFESTFSVNSGDHYKLSMRYLQGTCANSYMVISAANATQSIVLHTLSLPTLNNPITSSTTENSGYWNADIVIPTGFNKLKFNVFLLGDSNFNNSALKGYTFKIGADSILQKYIPYIVPSPTPSVSITPSVTSTSETSQAFTLQVNNVTDYIIYGCGASNSPSINWGDGNVNTITDPDDLCDNGITHTYSQAGNYTIQLYGDYQQLSFDWVNQPDSSTSQLLHWGEGSIQNIQLPSDITTVPNTVPSTLTDMTDLFYNAALFNQDISNWDVSNVTVMDYMFQDAAIFDQPLNSWDVSNVTSMHAMLAGTPFNQPLNLWNVSNVINMGYMFWRTSEFNQDISNWNVGNVSDMEGMFQSTNNFNQPLNSWNTSHLTSINGMFYSAASFNQPLNSWDTSAITDMGSAFTDAVVFNQDLSSWCVTHIPSIPYSFDTGATAWTLPRPVWGTCP